MAILDEIKEAVVDGETDEIEELVHQAIDEGIDPNVIINDGLIGGMDIVAPLFRDGEMFVPEVMEAADCMKLGTAMLKPLLGDAGMETKGKVVIGTIDGDLHDIGKNLVVLMLESNGYEVIDLGIDVEAETFAQAVEENKPQIVGLSSMLTTTTMQHYKDLGYAFLTMTNYGHMGVVYHPEDGSMPEGLTWLCDGQEAAINGTGNPNQSAFPCKHSCVWNTKEAYPWMPQMEWQEWADMTKLKGEIITIAHPAWSSTYQQPEVLNKIKGGIRFCEVYNGACDSASKAGSQTSSGYPIYTLPEGKDIDFAWEALLDNGCVTWGIGVSDAHSNNNLAVLANGCVKVFADHNERFEIMKNLCNGNFYACSNISASINGVSFEDGTLTIDIGDADATTVFLKESGTVLSTVTGATASYTLDGTEKYVRAVITLSSGERVWTQPVINLFAQDYDNYFDFCNI